MSTSLLIRVLHVSGICTTDADAGDVYCVLSTGACRFTTRNLCGKRSSTSTSTSTTTSTTSSTSSSTQSSQEAFLLSPRDLKVASTRVLQAAAGSTAASATPTAANPDSSTSHSSPVLSVEIYASKRWGSDAVTASGELLLGPLLQQLQPDGAPQQAKVMLHKPNAKTAAAKAARSASTASSAAAAAAAAVSTCPGIESGWVLGVESQVMVLELAALSLPQVPMHLLGPVGSGRAEVPPVHSCSAAWLNRCPVLQTTGGHLYQTPSVQLVKVTLHGAQGLQNLHVDPVAAAAAAAAINRMAATGDSPIRSRAAERARQAATAATSLLESSKVGKSLLNKTGSWFNRSKPSTAPLASVTAAADGSGQTNGSAIPAAQPAAAGTGADGSSQQHSRLANASAAGSALGASLSRAVSPAAGAPAAAGSAGSAAASPIAAPGSAAAGGRSSPVPSPGSFEGKAAAAADEDGVLLDSPRSTAAAEAAAAAAAAAASTAEEDFDDGDEVDDASLFDGSSLGVLRPGGDSSSCEDPVSRLKQALQHTRTDSVDAEAVMAALEENGFHATDAPGGAFVYAKLSLDGDSHVSRVVELGQAGEAVWEQSFWLAVARPAAPGTTLEVELLASKDDKTRGKPVAHVKAPLHQLLQHAHHPDSSSSSSSAPWFTARHVMQARFSDHLHGTLSFTVEAADWDSRAALAGLPRTLPEPESAAHSSQPSAAGSRSPQKQRSSLQLSRTAAEAAAAAADAAGSPTAQQQQDGFAKAAALNRSDSSLSNRSEGAKSAAGAASGAAVTSGSSSSGSGGSTKGAVGGDAAAAVQSAAAAQQRPSTGVLDLAVKAFDTRKPLDVFFVLLLGPYCLVSSTSHSTHHHSWGWHLQLPLGDPSDMLTLALFAREDQAGGKRKVGASMLTNLFSSSIRLVGKMRVRLSTITPNAPFNITMPLQGERTNLRAGHNSAAVAHLYFYLRVPHLLRYLGSYFRFAACTPQLYLLASSSSGWGGPGGGSQDCRLEALACEVQETAARWLEQQQPCLPAKIFRKVQDDGRAEFTLSRTRANWRRLILLREATAPAWAAFQHLCSWENTLHSVGCYCVILLLGMYPSKVLSVLLLLCCIALARSAFSQPGKPTAAMVSLAAAAASTSGSGASVTTAAAGDGSSSSSNSRIEAGWQLFAARAPPVMCDVAMASPEDALPGTAVPTDPYTSLKQNYDGLVQFLTLVQNVLDHWAAAGERLQLMFSWSDQLATCVVLLAMLLLAAGLWLLGLRVLITAGLLWVFRHPILRDPLPPPPVNFVARMPTQSDVML